MQQQSRATTDPYNVRGKKKKREEEIWEVHGLNLGCLLVLHEHQSQAVLSWQVDTIIYSSVQGHFTDWWIRPWARGVAGRGALGLLFGCWGCVYSPLSLSSTPSTASVAILDPARGKGGKKVRGQRQNRRKRWGRGRGGAMSCLWPEWREGPRDMTDYRRGQSSRPMPRPQLSVMGAGRGMWGTERGRKQERQVLVKEGGKKRKEKKKKTLWKDSATKCPDLCGSLFLQMLAINYKTHHGAHTHLKHVLFFTMWLKIFTNKCKRIPSFLNYLERESKLEKCSFITRESLIFISYVITFKTIGFQLHDYYTVWCEITACTCWMITRVSFRDLWVRRGFIYN